VERSEFIRGQILNILRKAFGDIKLGSHLIPNLALVLLRGQKHDQEFENGTSSGFYFQTNAKIYTVNLLNYGRI
jgi:hypothetical protein